MGAKSLGARLGMIVAFLTGSITFPPGLYGQTAKPAEPVELDVPFVATHQQAVDAMLKLAKVIRTDYVFDLGCGDGRIVITAAKKYKARGFGVDLDPQRIRESNANAKKAGVTDLVKFKLEDIMVTDVREATVVGLFLLDSVNLRLRPRLFAQLKPGSRVVSNTFHMADWKADEVLRHGKAYEGVIHLWIIPAPVGGTWKWKTKTPAGEIANSVSLDQQFQVITGAVRFPKGAEAAIADASLSGTQIKFSATPRIAGKEVKIVYEGKAAGDTIKGTQKWLTGPSAGTRPWIAKRDRVDVTGRWQIKAPGYSSRNGTLRIARKDKGLVATYLRDGPRRKEEPVPAFYVWGSSVRFEIPLNGTTLAFVGSMKGDAGGGTVSAGAGDKKTKWTAKRVTGK